jgi:putative DNA primase/helicase
MSRDPVKLLDQEILSNPGLLMPLMREQPEVPPASFLKRLKVADVLTNPPSPPGYAWEGLVPTGHVTLMSAHGGVGKSTIALMLCVAAALNRPLFGIPTNVGKVLFVSLEDAQSVVRHRLAWIAREWNLNPVDLDGRLAVVDGTDHPEMFKTASQSDAGTPSRTYYELDDLARKEGFDLIVIDNASDAFDGDEIQRRQVRAFMRTLTRLAKHNTCAILLLAHVDKGTSRSSGRENDEGYSGSTAWHNSSRSRLFLRRKSGDMLALVHQKNNLGRLCKPLELIWPEAGLPVEVRPEDPLSDREKASETVDLAVTLLRLLAEFEDQGVYCSTEYKAKNNVCAVLRGNRVFKSMKIGNAETRAVVLQCLRNQWLEAMLYRTEYRKEASRLTVTKLGREFAGVPALSAPCALSQGKAQ